MSYGWIKDLLAEHFPMQDEWTGSVLCACGVEFPSDPEDPDMANHPANKWAEHVEQEYNKP